MSSWYHVRAINLDIAQHFKEKRWEIFYLRLFWYCPWRILITSSLHTKCHVNFVRCCFDNSTFSYYCIRKSRMWAVIFSSPTHFLHIIKNVDKHKFDKQQVFYHVKTIQGLYASLSSPNINCLSFSMKKHDVCNWCVHSNQ